MTQRLYEVTTTWTTDEGDTFRRVHERRGPSLESALSEEREHNEENMRRGMAEDGWSYEVEAVEVPLRPNDLYSPFSEHIRGGLSSGLKPEDFDPVQLARGIEVEMEHTDDPAIATEIAMDHLVEDPLYYVKLDQMERGACDFGPRASDRLAANLRKSVARYYVFEMKGKKPYRQVNVRPLTEDKAEALARIGAQNGKHDRVVTTDPRDEDFEIVVRYKRGTGKSER